MSEPVVLVQLEGTLWKQGRVWSDAVHHVSGRFSRVRALDLATLGNLEDQWQLPAQLQALDAWAGDSIAWERELVRWLDEHLPLYVRPDRSITQALRTIAARSSVAVFSALPRTPMEALLRHAGALRPVADLYPNTSCGDLPGLACWAGGTEIVVVSADPAAARNIGGGSRIESSLLELAGAARG